MTWIYQMNFQTVKESNAALRRIKGTSARKSFYFQTLFPPAIVLFVAFIHPVIDGDFNLGSSLFFCGILLSSLIGDDTFWQ